MSRLILTLCLLGSGAVRALALTLEEAEQVALENHPALVAADHAARAARELAGQAGTRPNPELELEAENLGGSGEYEGSSAAEYTVAISQPLETGGKRKLRSAGADIEVKLADLELQATRRSVLAGTRRAFTAVLAAQDKAVAAQDLVRVAGEVRQEAARRVKAGAAAALEEVKAGLEEMAARTMASQADEELKASRIQLASALALTTSVMAADGHLDTLPAVATLDELQDRLERSPSWVRWDLERELLMVARRQAQADAWPDINAGAGVRQDEASGDYALLFRAAFPLPVWSRNSGARKAASLNVTRGESEAAAARFALSQELSEAWRDWTLNRAESTALRDELVPASESAFRLAREGHQLGRFTYLDVLDAERTWFENRMRLIETLKACHDAAAAIDELASEE